MIKRLSLEKAYVNNRKNKDPFCPLGIPKKRDVEYTKHMIMNIYTNDVNTLDMLGKSRLLPDLEYGLFHLEMSSIYIN